VVFNIIWVTGEGAHTPARISTDDVLVVALVLGKGFLKKRNPNSFVRAEACEQGLNATIGFHEGKIVVNDHGVRYSEGVEVESVDAVGAKLIAAQEKVLDTGRCLGKSSGCGEEPAVSKGTLSDVVSVHSISAKECVVGIL